MLGEGSYGTVHKAYYKITDSYYAIKKISKHEVNRQESMKKKLNREKEIMFKLNHPNIVKLKYTLYDSDYYFFLMEYAPNGTLAQFIDRHKKEHRKVSVECAKYIGA